MCLPTCARPDGPKCYKVPKEVKFLHCQLPAGPKNPTHEHSSPDHLYIPSHEEPLGQDALNCTLTDTDEVQASLRREKSRIAAKLRRQKENQALVKLRLTLPIHTYKVNTAQFHRPQPIHSTKNEQDSDSGISGDQHDSCALYAVSNYRLASSISRQHQIAAPEFEKAVTIRLAGNSLCLYNWLYGDERSGPLGSAVSNTSAIQRYGRPHAHELPPALSLFSHSLIVIVVDTTENTIVFAPPSYAELIGLPWNSIIGLQLPELRARQLTAASAAAAVTSPLTSKAKSIKSFHSHGGSTESLVSHDKCSIDTSLPRMVCTTTNPASHSKGVPALLWPVARSNRYNHLTTLIPPGSSASSGDESAGEVDSAKSTNECVGVHAICWASYSLPRRSGRPDAVYPRKAGPSPCDKFPATNSKDSTGGSSLRVFLFNPMATSTGKSFRDTEQYNLPSNVRPCSSGLAESSHMLTGPHASFVSAPRSYYSWDSLKFVGAQPTFLSALNYNCVRTLYGLTLFDLVHPEDLESVAEAFNALSPTEPVFTTLHRIRAKCGTYRWARLLGFLVKRDAYEIPPDFTHNHPDDNDPAPVSSRHESNSFDDRYSSSFVMENECRKRRCSAECCLTEPSAPEPADQPDGGDYWLVCCHQFAHFYREKTGPLRVTNFAADGTLKGRLPSSDYGFSNSRMATFQKSCAEESPVSLQPTTTGGYAWLFEGDDRPALDPAMGCAIQDVGYPSSSFEGSELDPPSQSGDPLCNLKDLDFCWKLNVGMDGGVSLANMEEFTKDSLKVDSPTKPMSEWRRQAPSIIPDGQHGGGNLLMSLGNNPPISKPPHSPAESNGNTDSDSLLQTPGGLHDPSCGSYSNCSIARSDDTGYYSLVYPHVDGSYDPLSDFPPGRWDEPGKLLPQAEIFAVPHGYFFNSSDFFSSYYERPVKKRRTDMAPWDHPSQTFYRTQSSMLPSGYFARPSDGLELYPRHPISSAPFKPVAPISKSSSYEWRPAAAASDQRPVLHQL